MTIQNFSMKAGNTKPISMTVEDVSNLSGATIEFVLKQLDSPTVILQKTDFTVVGNTLSITLLPTDTQGLTGYCDYECTITDAYGNVTTPISGTITFVKGGGVTAEQVFIMAMGLMGEISDDGTFLGYEEEYRKKAWSTLTLLQAELTPASQIPAVIYDETSNLYIDDRTALTVLPYGLAAHFLMEEDQTRASFFNARYDELKRKRPATISKIKDVYFGREEEPTTTTWTSSSSTTGGSYDGGEWT